MIGLPVIRNHFTSSFRACTPHTEGGRHPSLRRSVYRGDSHLSWAQWPLLLAGGLECSEGSLALQMPYFLSEHVVSPLETWGWASAPSFWASDSSRIYTLMRVHYQLSKIVTTNPAGVPCCPLMVLPAVSLLRKAKKPWRVSLLRFSRV